jgi:hypothetical protein
MVSVLDPSGTLIAASGAARPVFVDGVLDTYSEDVALADLKKSVDVGKLKPGSVVRIVSSLQPWKALYEGGFFASLRATVESCGAALVIVSCRESDPELITATAVRRAFKGGCACARIVRVEVRPGLPYFDVPVTLADAKGIYVNAVSLARDPGAFANAAGLTGIHAVIQRAARAGEHANILRERTDAVCARLDAIVKKNPLFLKTLAGTATLDERRELFEGLEPWDAASTGKGTNAGRNYVLWFTGVDVDELLGELTGKRAASYKVTGLTAVVDALRAHQKAGRGSLPVEAVNSGETANDNRPLKHVLDQKGGNPLPRVIGRAMNAIHPNSVSATSVHCAWTSHGADIPPGDATSTRMMNEPLLGILLHTQQPSADSARADGTLITEGDVVVIGTNVISGGSSVGDPHRLASAMQAGEQGGRTLRALRKDAMNVVPVDFLVDRLSDVGITRDVALNLTAKVAFAKYCSSSGEKEWGGGSGENLLWVCGQRAPPLLFTYRHGARAQVVARRRRARQAGRGRRRHHRVRRRLHRGRAGELAHARGVRRAPRAQVVARRRRARQARRGRRRHHRVRRRLHRGRAGELEHARGVRRHGRRGLRCCQEGLSAPGS